MSWYVSIYTFFSCTMQSIALNTLSSYAYASTIQVYSIPRVSNSSIVSKCKQIRVSNN